MHRCWNWFEPQTFAGRGEAAILMTMIGHATARANVDPARICVAGLSSGGALAALLAFTHPERFSSVTVHSGLAQHAANSISSALTAMRDGASLNMAALTRQYWRAHAWSGGDATQPFNDAMGSNASAMIVEFAGLAPASLRASTAGLRDENEESSVRVAPALPSPLS